MSMSIILLFPILLRALTVNYVFINFCLSDPSEVLLSKFQSPQQRTTQIVTAKQVAA